MAEIRCPMCGKSNPDHLDHCKFCEARLKPLIAPSAGDDLFDFQDDAEEENLPDWFDAGPDIGEDTPFDGGADDWMTRLGGDSESDDSIEAQIDQSRAAARMDFDDDGIPDWLEDLEQDEEGEEDSLDDGGLPEWLISDDDQEQATGEPVSDLDGQAQDWLSDFEEPSETAVESPEPDSDFLLTGDEGGLPDWLFDENEPVEPAAPVSEDEPIENLAQFVGRDTIPLPDDIADQDELLSHMAGEEPEDIEPAAEGEMPDWLADLEGAEQAAGEAAAAMAAEEGELPDWLASEEPEDAEPAAEGEMPDWLTDLEGAEQAAAGAAAAMAAEEGELPDWLASEEPEDIEPAAEGEMPDWLADLEGTELVDESTPAFDADDSELLGWLSDEEAESGEAEPAVEGVVPAWLTDMEEPASLDKTAPAIGAAEEGELPDWLAGTEPEDAEPAAEDDVPDWLKAAGGVAAAAAVAAVTTGDDEDELPDWLAGAEDAFDAPDTAESDEELPGWLAGMEDYTETPEAEAEPASPTAIVDESRAVPNWLQEMEGTDLPDEHLSSEAASESEPATVAPFVVGDEFEDDLFAMDQLPDWGTDDQLPEGAQESQDEADLAPAELPGWLAAMRPVESSPQAAEERGPAETSGPLAGLHSILAAQPDVLRLKKPPAYSSKLQVSEAQQSHAVLLKELLGAEKKPRELPRPVSISSHRIFKAVVGAIFVLIALLIVAAETDMTPMPAPETIPESISQTSQLIDSLTSSDSVLLAFDYEPGLAGEMDAAAAAVVDHMMLRGAKLTLVSTSPTGPALAERFINQVQGAHNYVSGVQYINLGYIPGGASGLASFVRNPQWVAPNTLDGVLAWETEPLQGVTQLSDFALILLITDNPNTAQSWIEQVQPQVNNVPMVAVVSAQVEPMIRPYYDKQQAQLSGLISGLPGGAVYEVVSRNNLARTYWDAFNIILIVAVSAIFIGGLVTIISDLLARRKESGGESA